MTMWKRELQTTQLFCLSGLDLNQEDLHSAVHPGDSCQKPQWHRHRRHLTGETCCPYTPWALGGELLVTTSLHCFRERAHLNMCLSISPTSVVLLELSWDTDQVGPLKDASSTSQPCEEIRRSHSLPAYRRNFLVHPDWFDWQKFPENNWQFHPPSCCPGSSKAFL